MTKLFLHNDNASVGRRVSGFVQVGSSRSTARAMRLPWKFISETMHSLVGIRCVRLVVPIRDRFRKLSSHLANDMDAASFTHSERVLSPES